MGIGVLPVFDLFDLSQTGRRVADQVGDAAGWLLEGNLRLGVTGLRRSGKTVFVTALVDNLLKAGRLPFLDVVSSGRFQAARLRPQPDADVPRFALERHLESLAATPPAWPEPTRGISQMRVAIRYRATSALRRAVSGTQTLNLDIVDYPGEWLLDLPLLGLSFTQWSADTLAMAERAPRAMLAAEWRGWMADVDPDHPAEEETARRGAALYTAFLHACRRAEGGGLSLIQPGRFVEPGDLVNAPLLTFCPLPPGRRQRGSLWALMEERFDAYRDLLVRRFFTEHFSRLDRQIVLVDVMGALNNGPAAWADMKRALELSLEPFRHGSKGWLDWLFGNRIDRVLFAATKADHIAASQHGNLRRLLDGLVAEARGAIRFEGAAVETMAVAALKCTESVLAEHGGRQLRCVRGVPVGRDQPTVLFPGDIPEGHEVFAKGRERPYAFLDFQPPSGGEAGHIRLDQALQFLIGDRLE